MNFYFVEFALNSLFRQKQKVISIFLIFTLLVFLLSSIFFISNSLKLEILSTVKSLPEIIIKKEVAGRSELIDEDLVDELVLIDGVSEVIPRVWGYYYSFSLNCYFSIVGLEEFDNTWLKSLTDASTKIDENSIIVGQGVKKILEKNFYKDFFNFYTPDNKVKRLKIIGEFRGETNLFSNDVIIMNKNNAKEILGIDKTKVTDIVLKVSNPNEVKTIASKLIQKYPNLVVLTKQDLKKDYEELFNYKGGVFLALFLIVLFTFFLLLYEKISSITSNELKEIGILRAIGWKIEDIIKEKLIESLIVSIFAYLLGLILAIFYVYFLNAPLLKNIFIGSRILENNFLFNFYFDIKTILLIFLLTVPIYLFATIIPAWKVAIKDIEDIIK